MKKFIYFDLLVFLCSTVIGVAHYGYYYLKWWFVYLGLLAVGKLIESRGTSGSRDTDFVVSLIKICSYVLGLVYCIQIILTSLFRVYGWSGAMHTTLVIAIVTVVISLAFDLTKGRK